MLNLVAGVDGLRAEGVDVRRVLLIGGASASVAVQEIAPQLFGVPVAIPAAGEYVGIGAARQAAWALSQADAPPVWEIKAEAEPGSADAGADVVGRYRDVLATMHGI